MAPDGPSAEPVAPTWALRGMPTAVLNPSPAVVLTIVIGGLLISAISSYAAIRQFGLDSDIVSGFLAAQSVLHGNVLLSGWHLTPDNFVFDEVWPLAVIEGVFGEHIRELTAFSAGIDVLVSLACTFACTAFTSSRVTLIGFAVVMLLFGSLPGDMDLPMLHPNYHGSGILLSVVGLMLLAKLAGAGRKRRFWTVCAFCLVSLTAIASDPFTTVFAFGPALVILGYDSLMAGRASVARALIALVAAVVLIGHAIPLIFASLGGFRMEPNVLLGFVAPGHLPHMFVGVLFGFLDIAGANIFGWGGRGPATIAQYVRLAMWICGIVAVASCLRRNRMTTLDRQLLMGIAVLIAACLVSKTFDIALNGTLADGIGGATRYLSPLVVFGTVLIARAVPGAIDRLSPGWIRTAATILLLAGACGLLADHAAKAVSLLGSPSWTKHNVFKDIGRWLLDRDLTCGVSDYWSASLITAVSDGRISLRAVIGPGGHLVPFLFVSDEHWYAGLQHPKFAMWKTDEKNPFNISLETVSATYGKPTRIEQAFGYTVAYLPGDTCK